VRLAALDLEEDLRDESGGPELDLVISGILVFT